MTKRNKIALYLFALLAGLHFTSCTNDKMNKQTGTKNITGRFVNQYFLEHVSDTIAGTIPHYCYEMNFISPDSVNINYGFEEGKLAYKKEGSKYLLLSAIQGRYLPFT